MKPFIVIQGPVATRSGYGNHTRDLVTSLIRADKYEIVIISLPWGSTPGDALKNDNPEHEAIIKCIATSDINQRPDIFIQISVPNEFKPMGKYNIGITAGIETNQVSPEFLEGSNRMDLLITTSEHSKEGFVKTTYDAVDKNTNQKTSELRLEKPIEVLFEGIDTNVYKKTKQISPTIITEMEQIKDDFCFLFVGHWLKGNLGQDRKDIGMLIRAFAETFKNKAGRNKPALILKTSSATFSIIDRDELSKKIQSILSPFGHKAPNVYLLHGDLTDEEMNSLYNHTKIKSMISFTKGEGFGLPLLEFTATGKPVIAPSWSGHVDFLKDYSILLPGSLTDVDASAADKFLLKGSKWFTVDYGYAMRIIKDVTENYKKYLDNSRKQMTHTNKNFTLDIMAEKFVTIVDKGLKEVPQQMELRLPKLKKVEDAKIEAPKLKLPKLKKIEI